MKLKLLNLKTKESRTFHNLRRAKSYAESEWQINHWDDSSYQGYIGERLAAKITLVSESGGK